MCEIQRHEEQNENHRDIKFFFSAGHKNKFGDREFHRTKIRRLYSPLQVLYSKQLSIVKKFATAIRGMVFNAFGATTRGGLIKAPIKNFKILTT
jgi:hypothetical protein